MKTVLLCSFALIVHANLLAQDSTLVTIKAGEKVTDILSPSDIYQYAEFTTGMVVLKDGTKNKISIVQDCELVGKHYLVKSIIDCYAFQFMYFGHFDPIIRQL